MGTELLRPQDCLMRAFNKPNRSPNSSRSWGEQSYPKPRKRKEGSPKLAKGKHMVMGQVTILKHGESLDSVMTGRKKREASADSWEVAVFGSARLGPDPDAIPKEVRLRPVRCGDAFAGVGFTLSPSPRALPLPSFPRRRKEVGVDDSKTKGLRRLLRLE
ncbi:uncharacterized protein [Typha angustifolia]|uniref:uncharacterized protein n=1 Tax=Typha angustifolia TaxID=59011 RepID=UPI003C30D5B2